MMISRQLGKQIYLKLRSLTIPKHLKQNHIHLSKEKLNIVIDSLKKHCFVYENDEYERDFDNHLLHRLLCNRLIYLPAIDRAINIKGKNILEVGCGTGVSTVALAEQGANLTSIDIDDSSLKVAKDRLKAYGLSAKLVLDNALEAHKRFSDKKYDLVIFVACVEHMTFQERIQCLRNYMHLVAEDGFFAIFESPNRLWWMDEHTSFTPFFQWLPDDLAIKYAKYTDRKSFSESYIDEPFSEADYLRFLRQGRGFSFHELECAYGIPAEKLNIVSYVKRPMLPFSLDKKYFNLIRRMSKLKHRAWFQPYINLVLKKVPE